MSVTTHANMRTHDGAHPASRFPPSGFAKRLRPLLPLLCLLAGSAQAQFSYTMYEGAITITRYTGLGGAVTIPDTIDGLPVLRIGYRAFGQCTKLTGVTIPNSVTNIGDEAFASCPGLTNLTIPSSVTSVGGYALASCSGLASVTVPTSVTSIGAGAFAGCTRLTSITIPGSVSTIRELTFASSGLKDITIPDSITNIGNSAFFSCYGLTSITVPSSLASIGDGAFAFCSGLTSITIPNRVINIGTNAFLWCSRLTTIRVPDSVTSIGDWAFSSCAGLTDITVDALNPVYSSVDGVLFDKMRTTLIQYPVGKPGDAWEIPNSVTSIGGQAFASCSGLASVAIPDSVTSIGDSAFAYCRGLTNITTGSSVTNIGANAFASCDGLRNITLSDSVTTIGNSAFSECIGLTSMTIPNGVISIGGSAFSHCEGLTNVAIGNSVAGIGDSAFFSCSWLRSITIPDSVTSIGGGALAFCSSLTSVAIPATVTSIGEGAFGGCSSLIAITVDPLNTVYCSLDGVLFDKGRNALLQCPEGKVGGCTIPDSVSRIEGHAFYGCSGLTSVQFKGAAPSVALTSFLGATSATIYYLPGTTGWGPTFGGRPTALWVLPSPLVLTTPSTLGVHPNGFGFTASWVTNAAVVVEASPTLTTPTWTPIATNDLVNGSFPFRDPGWTNNSGRFYRLRGL